MATWLNTAFVQCLLRVQPFFFFKNCMKIPTFQGSNKVQPILVQTPTQKPFGPHHIKFSRGVKCLECPRVHTLSIKFPQLQWTRSLRGVAPGVFFSVKFRWSMSNPVKQKKNRIKRNRELQFCISNTVSTWFINHSPVISTVPFVNT